MLRILEVLKLIIVWLIHERLKYSRYLRFIFMSNGNISKIQFTKKLGTLQCVIKIIENLQTQTHLIPIKGSEWNPYKSNHVYDLILL